MIMIGDQNMNTILYLAQAYSKYPQVDFEYCLVHEAYQFAIKTYHELIKMGFEVFSPIMYTHPFHVAQGYPEIDYVAHDLKMMEKLMNNDGDENRWNCPHCGSSQLFSEDNARFWCQNCNKNAWKADITSSKVYDSGMVCVFANDCFHYATSTHTFIQDDPIIWDSHGAKQEYDFAHAHHIKCIRLSELLEKKKIEECEPF